VPKEVRPLWMGRTAIPGESFRLDFVKNASQGGPMPGKPLETRRQKERVTQQTGRLCRDAGLRTVLEVPQDHEQ